MDSCLRAVICLGLAARAQRFVGCVSAIRAAFPTCSHIHGLAVGLRGLLTQLRKTSPAPDVPKVEETLPNAREERQEHDPSHHVFQHGHLEEQGPESISPTRAGIKQAPS